MSAPNDPAVIEAAVERTLTAAGSNRIELESALAGLEGREQDWLRFLIAYMPDHDARTLDRHFLGENVALAAEVRDQVPASMRVPEEIFREYVLPYAHLDERRDAWRPLFFEHFAETARRSASIEDAVSTMNRLIYEDMGVTYHATKRPFDNMNPLESIEWQFASCTGLSILLASCCRAVGIPARVVGTPRWADGSGNHTWVEIWDHGAWKFIGATEPGPFGLTWFNDAARETAAADSHGIFAARWSDGDTRFPLAWAPEKTSVAADDVGARYADIPPTPRDATRIVTEPRRYVCPKLRAPLELTGRMDDPQWDAVPWTEAFVDIEGHRKPAPRFATRAKLCWDDTYLYVGAVLEDPHVFGTLTEKNAILFNDPDFEVFIDPDGDNHYYYELEINALGTIWELYLERPYRDGGPIHRGHNLEGVVTAVHVDGTLNDPSDIDRGWSVEIAIPWSSLAQFAKHTACPPAPGDRWRVNFSRVHWLLDVTADGYRKVPRDAHPEDNWVWSPQEAVDMHRPERWGYVTFSADAPGVAPVEAEADPTWPARERLMAVYYELRDHDGELPTADQFRFPGVAPETLGSLSIEADDAGWSARLPVTLPDGSTRVVAVDHEGRLREALA
ncbi:MAG: sugar-binding protein [Planctomycetota bacterium]|nr:sugar-binding protein [Planctomycetota bacterium]